MKKFIEVELLDGRTGIIFIDKIVAVFKEKDGSTQVNCLGMLQNNTGCLYYIKMKYEAFIALVQ